MIPRRVNVVKNICLGEMHMVAHCVDSLTNNDVAYGMGDNKWGQLGKNPYERRFLDQLEHIELPCIEAQGIKQYQI